MDKYDFMGAIQECFDDCSTLRELNIKKNTMIETIQKMFYLEFEHRKCIEECWKDYYNL